MSKRQPSTYTALDELLASPTDPLPAAKREHQMGRMWAGLQAMESAPTPSTDAWRVCSDAVNLMETLISMGEAEDHGGLVADCVAALAQAGSRHVEQGAPIRLTGKGIQDLRAVLEDYALLINQLPARVMVRCHRLTERRVQAILRGQAQAHDVRIVAV
jgi:hypothetical protein